MQTFRIHGLVAPAPAPRAIPAFGRRSPQRYGRATSQRVDPPPVAAPVPTDDRALPWVDQEFEEYFFE